MKYILLFVSLTLSLGCSALKTRPSEETLALEALDLGSDPSAIEMKTKLNKKPDQAFQDFVAFAKKWARNPNDQIVVNDAKKRTLAVNLTGCEGMRIDGAPHVRYLLDVKVNKKDAVLRYEQIEYIRYPGESNIFTNLQSTRPTTIDDQKKLWKDCFERLHNYISLNL